MRDAFGGVFMMRLFLVFIVVYVGFGAISFNYAKSFKVKNKVIDLVELSQVQPKEIDKFLNGNQEELDRIIANANYSYECSNKKDPLIKDKDSKEITGFCYKGIVVEKDELNKDTHTQTYTIKVYNSWNLGLFDSFLAMIGRNRNEGYAVNGTWEITGEAKVHVRDI